MDKTPFTLELKPSTAVAASGGTGTAAPKTTDNDFFVVEEMYAIAENTGAIGSALAGSALPLLAGSKAADVTNPTMNMVTGIVTIGTRSLSDVQVPLPFIALPPGENGTLRTPLVIPPGTTLGAAFTNNCSGTVTPRICFKGYKTGSMPTMP